MTVNLTRSQHKVIFLASLGGCLEFFEFTIFALFASYISAHFFPYQHASTALLSTFGVYAIGYLARPCGALVCGHIGDRYGRKQAFTFTVLLMSIATLLIGCLPSYTSIGIAAPLLLIFFRLLQGFSVGGEIPGATIFTLEHLPVHRRGLGIGLVFMSITLGNTMGGLIGFLLTHILSDDSMMAWGWRVPFFMGFLLGGLSFIIRRNTQETPVFIHMQQKDNLPFISVLKHHRVSVLRGLLLMSVSSTVIAFFLYLPTYLSTVFNFHMHQAFLFSLSSFFVLSIMTAIFGYLSDYIGRKPLLLIGCGVMLLASYMAFHHYLLPQNTTIFIFLMILAASASIINGCYALFIAEIFPPHVRYSGMGVSYSLGIALFGGLGPLIFTWLVNYFHDITAPGYYIAACAICTALAVLCGKLHITKST